MDTLPSIAGSADGCDTFRVLSIDGGGSKGVFAVGVLMEAEESLGLPCYDLFDLVYGTSVGAVIAGLIAMGNPAEVIRGLFMKEIPAIMRRWTARGRSRALRAAAAQLFGDQRFEGLDTRLGIVATRTDFDRPMVFKTSATQAIRGKRSFVPGFGATLADAVVASCSARPFFGSARVDTNQGVVDAIDGGFVANNPSLMALIDAVHTLENAPKRIAALSVGVGSYPVKKRLVERIRRGFWPVALLETTLTANANAMKILTDVLFSEVDMVRIDQTYSETKYATWLLESNPQVLERMVRLGRDEFRSHEDEVRSLLCSDALS